MTSASPTYVVAADCGDGPEPDPDEMYNDLAYAWKMADGLQNVAEAGVVYGVRDLRPGMTIEWCEPPDYLDVIGVSDPDANGMVTIDTVQGRFVIGGDCMFTEITPELADVIGLAVTAESDRLANHAAL